MAYNRGTCIECSHPITHHRHDKVAWDEKLEKRNRIYDETTAVSIAEVQKTIKTYNKEIEEATEEIGNLADRYSKLSLSGSFSGQVEKSVTLIETHLESISNKSDSENVKQMEESLKKLKKKLRLLQDAAKAAHEKVYHPLSRIN